MKEWGGEGNESRSIGRSSMLAAPVSTPVRSSTLTITQIQPPSHPGIHGVPMGCLHSVKYAQALLAVEALAVPFPVRLHVVVLRLLVAVRSGGKGAGVGR